MKDGCGGRNGVVMTMSYRETEEIATCNFSNNVSPVAAVIMTFPCECLRYVGWGFEALSGIVNNKFRKPTPR